LNPPTVSIHSPLNPNRAPNAQNKLPPKLTPTSSTDNRPVLPNDITYSSFQTTLSTLNAQLSPFAYEIRSLHPQTAPTRAPEQAVYALVNVTSDPQTALATLYTPDEIAFVRRLLDAIFDTNNTPAREVCAVKGMEAVRLARVSPTTQTQTQQQRVNGNGDESQSPAAGGQAASLTLDRAEKLVDGLVEQEWMDRSAAGYLTLSTRSLMELGQWLVETYNEPVEMDGGDGSEREWQRIKMCEGCKQIVTIVSSSGIPLVTS
jgi:non-structural maintenance of chromosomes element 1